MIASSSSSRVKSSQAANFERFFPTTRYALFIKTLTCPKNNKIFQKKKKKKKKKKEKEEKDEGCALPSRVLTNHNTNVTRARLDSPIGRESALSSSSSSLFGVV